MTSKVLKVRPAFLAFSIMKFYKSYMNISPVFKTVMWFDNATFHLGCYLRVEEERGHLRNALVSRKKHALIQGFS